MNCIKKTTPNGADSSSKCNLFFDDDYDFKRNVDGEFVEKIKNWGVELGFQQVGITDTNLSQAEARLQTWLANDFHGELDYMAKHGLKRSRPALLHENTKSIISVRLDYLPENHAALKQNLESKPVYAGVHAYVCSQSPIYNNESLTLNSMSPLKTSKTVQL